MRHTHCMFIARLASKVLPVCPPLTSYLAVRSPSKSKLTAVGYDRSESTEPTLMSPCDWSLSIETASGFDGGSQWRIERTENLEVFRSWPGALSKCPGPWGPGVSSATPGPRRMSGMRTRPTRIERSAGVRMETTQGACQVGQLCINPDSEIRVLAGRRLGVCYYAGGKRCHRDRNDRCKRLTIERGDLLAA
jgi:hypothetical protein